MAPVPIKVSCYLCGKHAEKLLHPDELTQDPPSNGFILCNYCHRPVCPDHVSSELVPKLEKIRPQQFCTSCADDLLRGK